jgi:hypothetical protein
MRFVLFATYTREPVSSSHIDHLNHDCAMLDINWMKVYNFSQKEEKIFGFCLREPSRVLKLKSSKLEYLWSSVKFRSPSPA